MSFISRITNVLGMAEDCSGPSFAHLRYIGRRWLLEYSRLLLTAGVGAAKCALRSDARSVGRYIPFKDWVSLNSGKHVLLLGASPSALEAESFFRGGRVPEDLIVVGCNWTNYLDVPLDMYISAHLVMCRLAQVSKKPPPLVVNPTPDGRSAGYGLEPIGRSNFGEDVGRLFSPFLGGHAPVLYTNRNVIFLMICAALALRPSSITFCGFENNTEVSRRVHFFARNVPLMKVILDDFLAIPDMDLMAHERGSVATEMLQIVYANFWASLFDSLEKVDARSYLVIKEVEDKLAVDRERHISEFVKLASARSLPLYRLGDTTLFSDLPISPVFGGISGSP